MKQTNNFFLLLFGVFPNRSRAETVYALSIHTILLLLLRLSFLHGLLKKKKSAQRGSPTVIRLPFFLAENKRHVIYICYMYMCVCVCVLAHVDVKSTQGAFECR